MKRCVALILFLIFISVAISGCGETVSGIGKDAGRIGKGVKTIFIRDGQ